MHGKALCAASALLLSHWFAAPDTPARELSFEDRVDAQRAIQRVYYSHQIEATKPFDEVFPREALERKVRRYLEQSAALEKFWAEAVTAEALERELDRVARQTRFPNRLLQIYEALDNDPLLIRECLARPVLVDRLVRSRIYLSQDMDGNRHLNLRESLRPDLARDRLRGVDVTAAYRHRWLGRDQRRELIGLEKVPAPDGPLPVTSPRAAKLGVLPQSESVSWPKLDLFGPKETVLSCPVPERVLHVLSTSGTTHVRIEGQGVRIAAASRSGR